MYYLKKVCDELKQATWEKPGKAIRNTLIVILVMVLTAMVYYGYDSLMQIGIRKWF